MLANMLAANPAKANPTTAPTATATGGGASGGNLAAGDYFYAYTWVDLFGETLAKESVAALTVASGNIPRITIPSLPTGVQSANIYLTEADGASGTARLYATGISSTTFDCSYALKTDGPDATVPDSNTTGIEGELSPVSQFANGDLTLYMRGVSNWISSILSGAPMDERGLRMVLMRHIGVAKAWYTAMNEIGTLASTNLGTFGYTVDTTGTGIARGKRTLA